MIIPNIWENKIDVPNHQPEMPFRTWPVLDAPCCCLSWLVRKPVFGNSKRGLSNFGGRLNSYGLIKRDSQEKKRPH